MTTREELLKAADEYARRVVTLLQPAPLPDHLLARDELLTRLRIAFLFPLMLDEDRRLLVAAHLMKWAVTFGVLTPMKDMSAEDRTRHDTKVRNAEAQLMELRERITTGGLMDTLTPMQKEIVEGDILQVHFKEA